MQGQLSFSIRVRNIHVKPTANDISIFHKEEFCQDLYPQIYHLHFRNNFDVLDYNQLQKKNA